MSLRLIRDYLDKERVKYTVLNHSPAFTAQEIAAATHITGHRVAKCVILSMDGELAIAVLPASCNVDLDLLGWIAGAERVELVAVDLVGGGSLCGQGVSPALRLAGAPWGPGRRDRDTVYAFARAASR
jgi:Ala-tRNA(Pro) deacylase